MIKRLLAIFTESHAHFQGQEEGEHVLLIARKHVFVLIAPFFVIFLAALAPIGVQIFFAEKISAYTSIYLFVISLWYGALWLVSFYILMIYSLKTIIVTNKRLIESDQLGFFNRTVSEFHLYRVQDISVKTSGFFETLLSFGTLFVQTAAEQQDFIFHQVANPEHVKNTIMQAVSSQRSKLNLD